MLRARRQVLVEGRLVVGIEATNLFGGDPDRDDDLPKAGSLIEHSEDPRRDLASGSNTALGGEAYHLDRVVVPDAGVVAPRM